MKIALCFHGLPRLIKECYDDISNYFINKPRSQGNIVDIYGHFWWDNNHKGKVNRLHVPETYSNDNPIDIFTNLYNPIKVIYEDCPEGFNPNTYPMQGYNTNDIKKDDIYSKIMASFLFYGLYCRFISITKVLKLFELFDKSDTNIINYDLIIIARTDLLTFDKSTNILEEIKGLDYNNFIYFPSTMEGGVRFAGEHPNRLGDWLFIGTNTNISIFCNNIISSFLKPFNEFCPIHNTERLIFWANQANVKLDKYQSTISIRRFPTEEWENPLYRSSKMITHTFYVDTFDINTYKFKPIANNILPFYHNKILFIT